MVAVTLVILKAVVGAVKRAMQHVKGLRTNTAAGSVLSSRTRKLPLVATT